MVISCCLSADAEAAAALAQHTGVEELIFCCLKWGDPTDGSRATPLFRGAFGYLALLLQQHQVIVFCSQQQQQKHHRLKINSILAKAGVEVKRMGIYLQTLFSFIIYLGNLSSIAHRRYSEAAL